MKRCIALALLLSLLFFSPWQMHSARAEFVSDDSLVIINYNIDNKTPYIFDGTSTLTLEDFQGQVYLYVVFGEIGVVPIHGTPGKEYVVYPLKDSGICYLFLEYNPYTGINYFIKDTVAYPWAENQDETLKCILPQDAPDVLLATEKGLP